MALRHTARLKHLTSGRVRYIPLSERLNDCCPVAPTTEVLLPITVHAQTCLRGFVSLQFEPVVMQVLVLIEPISTGYRATGPFQITGEGETTEAALEQLRSKIADLNKRGASLVMLDVPLGTAWLPHPSSEALKKSRFGKSGVRSWPNVVSARQKKKPTFESMRSVNSPRKKRRECVPIGVQ